MRIETWMTRNTKAIFIFINPEVAITSIQIMKQNLIALHLSISFHHSF